MFRNRLSTHLAGLVRPDRIAKAVRPAQLISRRGIATQRGFSSAGSAAEQGPWRGGGGSGAGRLTVLGAAAAGVLASALLVGRLELEDERVKGSSGIRQPSGQKLISYEEVQKHNKPGDAWVVIESRDPNGDSRTAPWQSGRQLTGKGNVYDVSDFVENHPGGVEVIYENAGKDATKIFKPLHPPDALEMLSPEQHLGPVDPTTMPDLSNEEPTEEEKRIAEWREKLPPVGSMLLLDDFEYWAEKVLSGTGWNYYKSAADREITVKENEDAFLRYFFRPRILRDVTNGSTETEWMGIKSELPIFICPAAMAKLGHPLGEVNLTKGAGRCGIVQGISINASCSLDEIMAARTEGQKVMFQIYLNKDRSASETLLKKVTDLGAAAIIFTVDTPYRSKRTMDVRAKVPAKKIESPIKDTHEDGKDDKPSAAPLGVSQAISGYQDTNLTWGDIAFIRKNTPLPIVVKGIQSIEDVQLCVDNGVEGVILSNHGGRQCDYAPAGIDLLYEIRSLRPDLFDKVDIMIDGGVRSGADVVKALALGAKAVGLGRTFLYANGTHGQEGVERVCQILQEEITNTMRNIGATKISDLKPEMVGPRGPWVGANRPNWAPKV